MLIPALSVMIKILSGYEFYDMSLDKQTIRDLIALARMGIYWPSFRRKHSLSRQQGIRLLQLLVGVSP